MVEHLEELRRRVFISLIAIAVGLAVGWFLYQPVFDYLRHFYTSACLGLPKPSRPPKGCNTLFVTGGVVQPFLFRFKISLYVGFGVALPVVLFQLWRFVTPGLTEKERRLTVPFIATSLVLFGLGVFFAFLTLPKGLHFLLGFAGSGITPLIDGTKYLSFILLLALAFGLSFEFPLVLIFLAWVNVLTSRRLRQWRRYAILLIVVFAAAITPSQDPFTLTAMAVPMILFYEASILVVRLMKR